MTFRILLFFFSSSSSHYFSCLYLLTVYYCVSVGVYMCKSRFLRCDCSITHSWNEYTEWEPKKKEQSTWFRLTIFTCRHCMFNTRFNFLLISISFWWEFFLIDTRIGTLQYDRFNKFQKGQFWFSFPFFSFFLSFCFCWRNPVKHIVNKSVTASLMTFDKSTFK